MNELAKALIGSSAFAPPKSILQAIPDHAVLNKISGQHSIYEEVWHLAFWQDFTLDWVQSKPTPYPQHASEGFPSDASEPWPALHDRFLAGTQNAAAIANDTDQLEKLVACPRHDEPSRTMSIHDQLVSLAAHNAYHLGRIVLLRQIQGHWPPPDGGDTW